MGKKKLYSASFTWNGKVITKRATTKEEAEKKRDQEKFMYEFGLKSLSSDILVKDWYPEWAEKYKHGRLSERAYKDDNSRIERFILPAIGHKKMRDVKQLDLMRILESMNETGYSKTSIMKVKSCMTQMFRDAIPNDIISHSPAAELPVPIGTKQARHIVITDEDRLAIINCKSKVHLWAMFLMFSGARPAEALILLIFIRIIMRYSLMEQRRLMLKDMFLFLIQLWILFSPQKKAVMVITYFLTE